MSRPKRKRKDEQPMPSIGNMRTQPVAQEVDNPFHSRAHYTDSTNPRRIGVLINVRESAITMLATKGAIDPSQAAAAVRFRQLWERLGGAGAGAMDYSRVVVDGGITPDPISSAQMEAGRELKRAEQALRKAHGEYAYKLVGYICGQGYSVHDLTETRRQRDTMTDNLRAYLDVLAQMWDLATQARNARR